jgi:hypothetical protein
VGEEKNVRSFVRAGRTKAKLAHEREAAGQGGAGTVIGSKGIAEDGRF